MVVWFGFMFSLIDLVRYDAIMLTATYDYEVDYIYLCTSNPLEVRQQLMTKNVPVSFTHYCTFVLFENLLKPTIAMTYDKDNFGKLEIYNINKFSLFEPFEILLIEILKYLRNTNTFIIYLERCVKKIKVILEEC